jgi:alcohol dehydrogenase (cytochrome c)
MIMAPFVYEDLVISGIGISEYGVKGWIGAFRLSDGEPAWRFNTVPGEGEPGFDTGSSTDDTPRGGGGIWVTPSLDAEKGLLYVAVGNPPPDFFGGVRIGKNLYTAAMIALDARSGKLQWFRQFVPHDQHDWDLTVTNPMYSTVIGGARRPVMSVAGKDGILRAIDRERHDQIYEVPLTTLSNPDAEPTIEGVHTCPGVLGGFEWSSPAFSPTLDMLVAPTVDWCGGPVTAGDITLCSWRQAVRWSDVWRRDQVLEDSTSIIDSDHFLITLEDGARCHSCLSIIGRCGRSGGRSGARR